MNTGEDETGSETRKRCVGGWRKREDVMVGAAGETAWRNVFKFSYNSVKLKFTMLWKRKLLKK